MAQIISVHIEGFVSVIGKIKYKFDRPGLNLITGKNGAGKTTIFNALAWCLYGQLLKPKSSILPWPHIISDEYRGCKVSVRLDSGYEVIRCNEFKGKLLGKAGNNRLIILQGGEEVKKLRGKVDTQRWINEYLGYSFQLFKSSILFAQELNSLLEDDGPTKKKTFDEAFASAFINRAKENCEAKLEILKKENANIQGKINTQSAVLETNRSLLEQIQEANSKFATTKARAVSKLRKEVRAIQKEKKVLVKQYKVSTERPRVKQIIEDLGDSRDAVISSINEGLRDEEFQLMLEITRYSEYKETLEQKQKALKSDKGIKCSECGQKLKGEKLIAYKQGIRTKFTEYKKEIRSMNHLIKIATKRRNRCLEAMEKQSDLVKELEEIRTKIGIAEGDLLILNKYGSKISVMKSQIAGLKKEISRVRKTTNNNDTTKVEADIVQLELGLKALETSNKGVIRKMEMEQWLIKDPLSNSGLKAFIFESMLKRVNYYLKYYTQFIGFQVNVSIDLESSNKDFCLSITKSGDEVPYEDLSKGQKQLAKAVLCFAVNKTLQASKPLNILLMDELFESLDPENVEIIGNIIASEAKNKAVHIITHHTSFNPTNCYKTYVGLNTKGQTVIEQKYREA